MRKRTMATASIPALLMAGCMSTYNVQLRDAQAQTPLAGAAVVVELMPPTYSYFDPRFSLCGSGHLPTIEGVTDSRGQFAFQLPADHAVGHVFVNRTWMVQIRSFEWTAMLTSKELESHATTDQLESVPGRPEIRLEPK
jgi:hypothetical protein